MKPPVLHLVGQRLAPELLALCGELQMWTVVYHFETTDELLAAWRLARRARVADSLTPVAVVWLQSRVGEFAQLEIESVQTLDPLARSIVVAGCWSEGEPRSGRLLAGVQRVYWHQGWPALRSLIDLDEVLERELPPNWIAIHTTQQADYQGLAGLCHTLGQRTIWQSVRGPAISSEPAVRLFDGWHAWDSWQEIRSTMAHSTAPAVLLLSFPRPADHERALRESIAQVIAQPFKSVDLQRAIAVVLAAPNNLLLSRSAPKPQIRHDLTPVARRRSA